ncbi:MAG: aldehyde dehydrogenase family protein, partial [Acidimicrobiales bacterium]
MHVYEKIYIDGAWVEPIGTGTAEVINSSTEEVMGRVPQGNAEDVDRAAKAARAAFGAWSQTSAEERGKYLTRVS